MATSYKIRLRRFNGLDYDTLNLLSENIIMGTGNTLQQDIVPNSNGMLKNSSGVFQIATLGTDYGALSFTVTLAAASWSNNAQTISDARFLASGYSYTISPAGASLAAYGEAQIYADNITVNGSCVFHCAEAPSSDLTVNILREVST